MRRGESGVHLVHVTKRISSGIFVYYQHFANYFNSENEQGNSRLKERLQECAGYIAELKNGIITSYSISHSAMVEKAIAEKAGEIAADLIVIGKNSQHSLLPFLNTVVPSRLAKHSGISVLTVKPGALSSTLKTVVVPINSRYSEKKVDIINGLKKKFYLNIRLLLIVERDDDPDKLQTSLVNTCRMLKNRSLDTISYEILHVGKKNWDILSYCRKVDADLLIVHPGTETKIGWLNKHISDELPVNSKTQVLAVGQDNLSLA